MKNILSILFSVIAIFTLIAPTYVLAVPESSSGLVPCGTEREDFYTTQDASGKTIQTGGGIKNPCDFNYLFTLINKVVNFVLFVLAVPISAVLFAYAGIQLMFSGGSTEAMTKAKKTFTSVAIGLVLAITAFLIVNAILSILGYDGSWIGFK